MFGLVVCSKTYRLLMRSIAVRCEVANLTQTLTEAQTAGVKVLVQPYEVE
jgi:hypothetical protein